MDLSGERWNERSGIIENTLAESILIAHPMSSFSVVENDNEKCQSSNFKCDFEARVRKVGLDCKQKALNKSSQIPFEYSQVYL